VNVNKVRYIWCLAPLSLRSAYADAEGITRGEKNIFLIYIISHTPQASLVIFFNFTKKNEFGSDRKLIGLLRIMQMETALVWGKHISCSRYEAELVGESLPILLADIRIHEREQTY